MKSGVKVSGVSYYSRPDTLANTMLYGSGISARCSTISPARGGEDKINCLLPLSRHWHGWRRRRDMHRLLMHRDMRRLLGAGLLMDRDMRRLLGDGLLMDRDMRRLLRRRLLRHRDMHGRLWLRLRQLRRRGSTWKSSRLLGDRAPVGSQQRETSGLQLIEQS